MIRNKGSRRVGSFMFTSSTTNEMSAKTEEKLDNLFDSEVGDGLGLKESRKKSKSPKNQNKENDVKTIKELRTKRNSIESIEIINLNGITPNKQNAIKDKKDLEINLSELEVNNYKQNLLLNGKDFLNISNISKISIKKEDDLNLSICNDISELDKNINESINQEDKVKKAECFCFCIIY